MPSNFQFGESTNSPSTPNRKSKGFVFSQTPSTTPAGPPPSWLTNKSTTPAGPPPHTSKMFGSSYNASNNTFGRRGEGTPPKRAFAVPLSSPPGDGDEDEDAEGEENDDGMQEDYTRRTDKTQDSLFVDSIGDVGRSPRGLKRSRNGEVRDQVDGEMAAIARQMAKQSGSAALQEPDEVVVQTEQIVSELDQAVRGSGRERNNEIIAEGVTKLSRAWRQSTNPKTKKGGIGPQSDNSFARANYVASLLLQLHQPHLANPVPVPTVARARDSRSLLAQNPSSSTTVPRALLDWLNTYHNPFPDDFNAIHLFQPASSAHDQFWDIVYSELLRGKIQRSVALLRDAGWQHAVTALDDGSPTEGYRGQQLQNTEMMINEAVRVLESCPAVVSDDWDVRGADWQVFRQQVRRAIEELEAFAEGDGDFGTSRSNVFEVDDEDGLSMSRSTRRAESKVPWSIYQNLKMLYRQALGEENFVFTVCQDWVEAAILMTVWWDGEERKETNLNATLSRSLRKSVHAATREVDVTPLLAYRRRLAAMLGEVSSTDEACFHPDTMEPVQVGLACAMDGNIECTVALLQTWNQTITAAVVEVAALGGWLPRTRPSSRGLLQQGFSSEDLMVLSHGPGQSISLREDGVDRDGILVEYAELLVDKDLLRNRNGKEDKEGWELAVSVLGRADDMNQAQNKIGELLEQLNLSKEGGVDKVLDVCGALGLAEQGRAISERFADSLADGGQCYGSALIYYARAHAVEKINNTIAILIAQCLLHSAAVPPQATLDPQLASLLGKGRKALVAIAHVDADAAALLSSHLSGYATVRRFYELRDSTSTIASDISLRPLERKRQAASALVAIISSAADCIRGGLFDPDVQSVIPVDGLLALLGETLPLFLGAGPEQQPSNTRIFTQHHVFALLRTLEDFDTAPRRVREAAETLLRASVDAYRRQQQQRDAGSSVDTLAGSSYDLLLPGSASASALQAKDGSGSAVEFERAWDWRVGLDAATSVSDDNAETGGKQVLMLLRTALAQEVARGWGGLIRW